MVRAVFFYLLLLVAPALGSDHEQGENHGHHEDHHDGHEHEDDHHVAEAGGVRAVHAWTNATQASTILVFVDIENNSEEAVTLIGAQADIAASAQLVALENVAGELRYTAIPQLPIPANSKIVLAPNGLAVQLAGLSQGLEQDGRFVLTLVFEETELPVIVEVESASATQHSHVGHSH